MVNVPIGIAMAMDLPIGIKWIDYREYSPEHNSIVIAWGYEFFKEDDHLHEIRRMRMCTYIVTKNSTFFIQVPSTCDKVFELHNVTHWMRLPEPPRS